MAEIVRVYQEDWWPFQNLPAALARFEAETGIRAVLDWDKVGVGSIEHMFDHMERSFTEDDPPFDLVCADEILLRGFAAEGRVEPLDDYIARDGYPFDDISPETRRAITLDGRTLGLPCVNVSNLLLYRRDLLHDHGLRVPQTMAELTEVAVTLQELVRRDEKRDDFYGFATRGAAGGGHGVWSVSSFVASFGGSWLDEKEHPTADTEEVRAGLWHYLDLLHRAGPPDQPEISFVELMRDFAAGRVGMILEVGMEYAHLLAAGGPIAERAGVALIPAGPVGRHPNLYSPPWAIPARSPVKEAAWRLAAFLCSPAQLLEDGLESEAIETSRESVVADPAFDRHFRPDLLRAVRETRAFAREERPFSTLGLEPCRIVGDLTNRALRRDLGVAETTRKIQDALERLVGARPDR